VQRDGVGRLVFKDVELVGLPKKTQKNAQRKLLPRNDDENIE
jgi:hypothetical protein